MEYDYGVSKRITETKSAIIFCAIIFVVATILLISTFKPSVNISKEFLLYSELKNIKDSATLVETLKDKQIAYSLDGEKIILEDCSYFYFKFNDGEIKIISTDAMKACNSIKHNSSTKIKTKNKTINGENVTVLYLEADDDKTYAYDTYNGYYIIQSGKTTILSRIGFCSIAFFMAALIVYQSIEYKKLIKTTKKKSNSTIQYIIGGEK